MLKIRMQGMTSDIEWFQKILEEDKRIRVLGISEPFANKGTNKYFRVYAEVNKKEKFRSDPTKTKSYRTGTKTGSQNTGANRRI